METLTPLLKAILGAGALGFIASLLTWRSATRKNKSDVELAMRRLENEEETQQEARAEALRLRENALYERQIADLKAENDRLLRVYTEKVEEEKRRHGRRS